MRILRVAQHLYPDTKGGGQYHVHAMSRDQAAMGHDVTVLTTRVDSSLPRREETHGYRVIRVSPGLSVIGNHISPGLATVLRKASAEDFDVIHAHSHLYFATNLAALKRRLGPIPLAITNHGLYSQSAPERVFRWYLKTLGRWTFNRADVVFCYTPADRDRLRDLGVSTRVAVVPNGIDTERFTPEGAASSQVERENPVVLFVGRLVEGKRPADAIRAVQALRSAVPEVELVVCGDGPLRGDLADLAGEETTFLGQVPYDEMPGVYRAGDALVLPSRAEGTPRTVLEALACGTPVACTDVSNLRAAFGDAACYFERGDVDEISACLAGLLRGEYEADRSIPRDWSETVWETTEVLENICGLAEG